MPLSASKLSLRRLFSQRSSSLSNEGLMEKSFLVLAWSASVSSQHGKLWDFCLVFFARNRQLQPNVSTAFSWHWNLLLSKDTFQLSVFLEWQFQYLRHLQLATHCIFTQFFYRHCRVHKTHVNKDDSLLQFALHERGNDFRLTKYYWIYCFSFASKRLMLLYLGMLHDQ